MKKVLFSLLLIRLGIFAYAQNIEYSTKLNINYYSDSISQTDDYIKEQCVLDIYYPKNIKDFATVVWFHGGGLTSGSKEFPEALKGKGICVVAVNYRLYPKINSLKCIEDAAASVAWVFNNIKNFGGDSSLIFISGLKLVAKGFP